MKLYRRSFTVTAAVIAAVTLAMAWPCAAQTTWTVTSTGDDSSDSTTLRGALAAASDGDTINITATGTIYLDQNIGQLNMDKSVTITGPGQALLTIDGGYDPETPGTGVPVFSVGWSGIDLVPGLTAVISGLTIAHGGTGHIGGAIYNVGTLTVSDCTLRNNYAKEGGGGICSESILFEGISGGTLVISGCTFSDNHSSVSEDYYGGGAVTFLVDAQASSTLTIEDSDLSNNSAPYGGGIAINVMGAVGFEMDSHAYVNVTNSTLNYNSATTSSSGYSWGGAMSISFNGESSPPSTATVTLEDCTLIGNSATVDGGIAVGGAIANSADFGCQSMLTLSNSTLSDNSSGAAYSLGIGGAIANLDQGGSAEVTMTDCTFADNSTVNAGGAIYNGFGVDATAVLSGCELTGNSVTADYPYSELDIMDFFFPGGGAIYNGSSSSSGLSSLVITDSTLSENTAQIGGAILTAAIGDEDGGSFYPANTSVSIVRSTLSGNSAVTAYDFAFGGAIVQLGIEYTPECSLTLDNSTLAGNWAYGPTGADASGGAILNGAGQVTLNNCTLSGNSDTAGISGIGTVGGTVDLKNTILANDSSGANLDSNAGTVTSYGFNLSSDGGGGYLTAAGDQINIDPMLGPLQDNGGLTWTCALMEGSPAIDMADSTGIDGNAVECDQRGVVRPQGDTNDIGAFELEATVSALDITDVTATSPSSHSPLVTVTVLISNANEEVAYDVTVTSASLDGVDTNSRLPLVYGAIKPGESKKCTLQFKDVPAGDQTLTVNGTSSLGDFFIEQTVSVP